MLGLARPRELSGFMARIEAGIIAREAVVSEGKDFGAGKSPSF